MNYPTIKKRRGRFWWASRMPRENPRLESAVAAARGPFFEASVVVILPEGEIRVAQVAERGRRLEINGRGFPKTVAPRVFWDFVDALRKADST